MNEETETKLQTTHPSLLIFHGGSTLPLMNDKAEKAETLVSAGSSYERQTWFFSLCPVLQIPLRVQGLSPPTWDDGLICISWHILLGDEICIELSINVGNQWG